MVEAVVGMIDKLMWFEGIVATELVAAFYYGLYWVVYGRNNKYMKEEN
jgi:hypothetical protein